MPAFVHVFSQVIRDLTYQFLLSPRPQDVIGAYTEPRLSEAGYNGPRLDTLTAYFGFREEG